ncbi:methionine adenosyltransferase [Egibacter rhizosphaerae]|uniref:S-adenosylmethionine synthase n=1 Tax=Egibacter rhizosphaerae TaxID=1670831 RepID=A0A411YK07_9ACTN|nr:methionine adenosyltransferase [Egibacter rhizosphaerae]QBI21544.1 methionine adenosyltransferase [Egibacter rhizosphaerae]
MSDPWLFTSESVTEGHPDKLADQISDAVLDAVLTHDPDPAAARVAVETLVTTGLVIVAGEVSTQVYIDINRLVRETVTRVGYDRAEAGFDGNTCGVLVALDEQSPDIAGGVDKSLEVRRGTAESSEFDSLGAGDQGMVFGYATDETPTLMPTPIHLAHRLAERLAHVRHSGEVPYLRPDGKTQVTVEYGPDGRPQRLVRVLISAQHRPDIDTETLLAPDIREQVIAPVMLDDLPWDDTDILVNPSGRFEFGGPQADAGVTGRKVVVDTYGGMARHGGGAFSGKDATKVDRSAAYAARWVAKHVVAAGLARKAELQVAYAIGVAHPVSIMLDTFGTEQVDPARIRDAISEVFDLRPAALIADLGLRRPIFRATSAYGHFGREGDAFSWERVDRVDALRRAAGS